MFRARLLALAMVAVLAFLAWPQRALAAILPACEEQPMATWLPPPPAPPPLASDCEAAAAENDDDTVLSRGAPICDPQGASAVAPQRILPVEDSRLEAGPPMCAHDEGSTDTALGPQQQERPASASFVLPMATLPDLTALAPTRFFLEVPAFPAVVGEAREGLGERVYHPPR